MVAAVTGFNTNRGRIHRIKGKILAHAVHDEVLSMGCKMERMPRNMGKSIIYRRWLPRGATTTNANTINRPKVVVADHVLSEGVTPSADRLVAQDVTITIERYGVLYAYTDDVRDLHEDDVPAATIEQVGERMALVREMIRYGAMKAATNIVYAGGTSRGSVDEAFSLNHLRQMTKTLKANHAKMKTRVLAASANYATYPVEPAYCVFVHTDAEPDLRDLPNFKTTAEYGSRKPISMHEIGSCESFRFITSAELAPYAGSGATSTGTGLTTTARTQVDVYPFIVCAENAVFDVALRGLSSMNINHLTPGQIDKSDPLGQRGNIGGKFFSAVKVVNNGWFGIIEAGVTHLN